MATTDINTPEGFMAARDAWVAKGRPADPTDAYWASVLEAQAQPRPTFVAPLVELG